MREVGSERSRCCAVGRANLALDQRTETSSQEAVTTQRHQKGMWVWSHHISLLFKRHQKSGFSVKLLDFTELGSILFKHTHEVG